MAPKKKLRFQNKFLSLDASFLELEQLWEITSIREQDLILAPVSRRPGYENLRSASAMANYGSIEP